MSLTAPWSIDAENAIRSSLRVVTSAVATHPSWAGPLALEVVGGTVTFDEAWSPHVQAELVCALPADQTGLELLDPRDLVRVQITAGYVYPGSVEDSHQLVDLGLRSRAVRRPDNTISLSLSSDEALVQDAGASVLEFYSSPSWSLPDMLTGRLPVTLGYTPAFDMTDCPTAQVPVQFSSTDQQWDTYKGAVDVAGGWLRDRGDRTWVCSPWPTTAGQPVHLLRTGIGGTVVESDVTLGREEWANVVVVTYTWTSSGTTFGVSGWAYIGGARQGITAPAGFALPGIKLYQETRQGQATVEQAKAAAKAMLTRRLRRARGATLTARAAYWVRPGKTVAVQLPVGKQELHLVSRVTFDLGRGEMTLTTRQPDNTPISTGA